MVFDDTQQPGGADGPFGSAKSSRTGSGAAKLNDPDHAVTGEPRAHVAFTGFDTLWFTPAFEMGKALDEAREAVSLNHPLCARFRVLGGATCNAG